MDEETKNITGSLVSASEQYQITAALITKALNEESLEAHKAIIKGLRKPRKLSAFEVLFTLFSLASLMAGVYFYNVTLEPADPCVPLFGTGQFNDPIIQENPRCRTK